MMGGGGGGGRGSEMQQWTRRPIPRSNAGGGVEGLFLGLTVQGEDGCGQGGKGPDDAMECEHRQLAAPQDPSTRGAVVPAAVTRSLDFGSVLPSPSSLGGTGGGVQEAWGGGRTPGVTEPQASTPGGGGENRTRLEEIRLWRPYHDAEQELVAWVGGLQDGSVRAGTDGERGLKAMIHLSDLLLGWADQARREEVDKLVAEAAASVSALETQIHRHLWPDCDDLANMRMIPSMLPHHPSHPSALDARCELQNLIQMYRSRQLRSLQDALSCLSSFTSAREWAQPVDSREAARLSRTVQASIEATAVLAGRTHRHLYPACDGWPRCGHPSILLERAAPSGGAAATAAKMSMLRSEDGTSSEGSLPAYFQLGLEL